MKALNGREAVRALACVARHACGSRTDAATRQLKWVLCAAPDDAFAVEGAFEDVYGALTDASPLTPRQFEMAAGDLERAYDARLAAALAAADGARGSSPERGKPSSGPGNPPYVFLQPTERNAG